MAKIIDGKAIAAEVKARVAAETEDLKARGITPGLAVILVGDDPASQIYVNSKERECAKVGFYSEKYVLPASASMDEILALVDKLNRDERLHGILCQLPLPRGLRPDAVINAISPDKDVDAFHPVNVGRVTRGDYIFAPCTPAGVMEMLRHEGIPVAGKHCVVVGRSDIVGKPMALLMLHADATVTVCHSKTTDLAARCREADILVAAVGKPRFITADMVKPGAVVIDVGMNRLDGKLYGDVNYAGVEPIAGYITPVPGGVGPMTIAMLLRNTLTAAKLRAGLL